MPVFILLFSCQLKLWAEDFGIGCEEKQITLLLRNSMTKTSVTACFVFPPQLILTSPAEEHQQGFIGTTLRHSRAPHRVFSIFIQYILYFPRFHFFSYLLSDIDGVLPCIAAQSMKAAPGQVLWEIVKQNDSYLVKPNSYRSTKIFSCAAEQLQEHQDPVQRRHL